MLLYLCGIGTFFFIVTFNIDKKEGKDASCEARESVSDFNNRGLSKANPPGKENPTTHSVCKDANTQSTWMKRV